MSKEEALQKLDELQKEETELKAEEASVNELMGSVWHNGSSRSDELATHVSRMMKSVRSRINAWCEKWHQFEQELRLAPWYAT